MHSLTHTKALSNFIFLKHFRPAYAGIYNNTNGVQKPSEHRSFVLVASLHALALCAYNTSRIALYASTLSARTSLPRKARRETELGENLEKMMNYTHEILEIHEKMMKDYENKISGKGGIWPFLYHLFIIKKNKTLI